MTNASVRPLNNAYDPALSRMIFGAPRTSAFAPPGAEKSSARQTVSDPTEGNGARSARANGAVAQTKPKAAICAFIILKEWRQYNNFVEPRLLR
jgi:hypothetical protein